MSLKVEEKNYKEFSLSRTPEDLRKLNLELDGYIPGLKLVDLQNFTGSDGSISILEFASSKAFSPQRLFFVHNVPPNKSRGFHAHRECAQLLIAANGVCTLDVVRGEKKLKVIMDNSERAVLVPRMTWATQTYSSTDSVLIVLASHAYDKEDYIEDFELYSQLIEEKEVE
jgi:dTDP-4-dehydrorhamnose 3,5-epimerase-like enzyme